MDADNAVKHLENNLQYHSVYEAFDTPTHHHLQCYKPSTTHMDTKAKNDERVSSKIVIRCTIGVVMYALGLLLFAWGKLLEPSLFMTLGGLSILLLGCRLFMVTEDKKEAKNQEKKNPVSPSKKQLPHSGKTEVSIRNGKSSFIKDRAEAPFGITVKL